MLEIQNNFDYLKIQLYIVLMDFKSNNSQFVQFTNLAMRFY